MALQARSTVSIRSMRGFLENPVMPRSWIWPQSVSHAVIAVNRNRVMDCIRQCAQTAVRHVIVISAGFKETDAVGAALEEEMAAFCREHEIVLLGPNTLGLINTACSSTAPSCQTGLHKAASASSASLAASAWPFWPPCAISTAVLPMGRHRKSGGTGRRNVFAVFRPGPADSGDCSLF